MIINLILDYIILDLYFMKFFKMLDFLRLMKGYIIDNDQIYF